MIKDAKRIVFKVGTSTLTHDTGRTNLRHVEKLVRALSDLMNSGRTVALVTSGAIGVGAGKLGLPGRPEDTPGRQAAAAAGQCELMYMYDKMFGEYGYTVGQLLITREDVEDPDRRRHLENTFERLFAYGAIPIINENDSVAVHEIVYGDNDTLSASVAKLIKADALVMLTDTDGLYDRNPDEEGARLIETVEEITEEIKRAAGGSHSASGTGGMATKVKAAKMVTDAGCDMVITNGARPELLYDIAEGKAVGTRFKAKI